jgi:hypothetical protein
MLSFCEEKQQKNSSVGCMFQFGNRYVMHFLICMFHLKDVHKVEVLRGIIYNLNAVMEIWGNVDASVHFRKPDFPKEGIHEPYSDPKFPKRPRSRTYLVSINYIET